MLERSRKSAASSPDRGAFPSSAYHGVSSSGVMKLQSDADDTVQQITCAFAQAAGAWTGCDWPTKFGSAHLNLDKLSSAQAMLMARATAGKEEDAWWEASYWLAQV